ncbi:MAG: hypothetical protein QM621_08155 [Aeromicrobium sp.]|uniref:hypothetical protein n=1 Tax=Aeromicrobium sp. TaxID=1871063 RepID=UPI0039E3CD1C
MRTPRCTVDDCGRPAKGAGLCYEHYREQTRTAAQRIAAALPPRPRRRACAATGCDERAEQHYDERAGRWHGRWCRRHEQYREVTGYDPV